MVNVGAIIQARYNSERLPGKILMPLPISASNSILGIIIERLKKVERIDKIVVATTTTNEDKNTETEAQNSGVACFRGSEDNVLERFVETAKMHELQHIVRVTADNPFIDPKVISQCIEQHLTNGNDYTKTTSLPLGTNIEIVSYKALLTSYQNASTKTHYEHVTPYIYQNPEKFKIQIIDFPLNYDERLRLTVDYPSDYAFANLLFCHFQHEIARFTIADIITYCENNTWLMDINPNIQKKVLKTEKEELEAASDLLKQHDFLAAKSVLDECLKKESLTK